MVNPKTDPVQYSNFMFELTDASEHLEMLITDIQENPDYDESDLSIDLGHIFAHLNRAWNTRNRSDSNPVDIETERDTISQFPNDLTPVG
jgi:hypothetical protein